MYRLTDATEQSRFDVLKQWHAAPCRFAYAVRFSTPVVPGRKTPLTPTMPAGTSSVEPAVVPASYSFTRDVFIIIAFMHRQQLMSRAYSTRSGAKRGGTKGEINFSSVLQD